MNRINLLLGILVCATSLQTQAASKPPKEVKNAYKAVCSIITFDSNGKLLKTGNGFFINKEGELLTDYQLLQNADSAVTIDAAGIERPVVRITGADKMYDVVKLRVQPDKKLFALSLDTLPAPAGSTLQLVPYSTHKNPVLRPLTVKESSQVSTGYHYYTLRPGTENRWTSSPLINPQGKVVAMVQAPAEGDTVTYALDGRFGSRLTIKALSVNDDAFKNIGISMALPPAEDQALVSLFMLSSQKKPELYRQLLEDFIRQYPSNYEGYLRRAELALQTDTAASYAQAEQDFAKALEVAEAKDEVYFQIGKQLFALANSRPQLNYKDWGLEKAAAETQKAVAVQPLPVYFQQLGDIYYTQKKYADAYEHYRKVNYSTMASADSYYATALACEQLPDSLPAAIALMDSAVNFQGTPLTSQAAPFVWERALLKSRHSLFRDAVADFNLYEQLLGYQVNDQFYYIREQAESNSRMFQQALDDIARAIEKNPSQALYQLELASLNIRVNRIDEAIPLLESLLARYPQDADCNRLLGFCYALKGETDKACPLFEKARSLGDKNVDNLIEKYCKE